MDSKEYRFILLETIKETEALTRKLLETPLLITDDELIALEYNSKIINDYYKELKATRGIE